MQKIGIKFEKVLDYERYESLQYWLKHDFEYEDLDAYVEKKEIIELELEEDEDREEDILMLQTFLEKFDKNEIVYELFVFNEKWEKENIKMIG